MTKSSITPNKHALRLQTFWRRHGGTVLALAAIALFLAVWEIVAICVRREYMLPRFSAVAVAFVRLWGTYDFYRATGGTLVRSLVGFGLAFAGGFLLGVVGGVWPRFRAFLSPVVAFFRAAPTMGLALVILVWLRARYTPVCIGFLMVFPIIYTTVADSIAHAPADLLQMAAVYHLPLAERVRSIYVPHAVPMVFSACSTAFALNIKATVSAEILAYTIGSVGMRMSLAASDLLDGSALLFAWLIVAVLLSVLVEALLKGLQYLVMRRYRHAI